MDARKKFDIETKINRVLIEAGLMPAAVTDPRQTLRGLAQRGSYEAKRLLADLDGAGM